MNWTAADTANAVLCFAKNFTQYTGRMAAQHIPLTADNSRLPKPSSPENKKLTIQIYVQLLGLSEAPDRSPCARILGVPVGSVICSTTIHLRSVDLARHGAKVERSNRGVSHGVEVAQRFNERKRCRRVDRLY